MIDDLDNSLKELLETELAPFFSTTPTISFIAPDGQFPPPSVTLPAINLFLYDMRENVEMRASKQLRQQEIANNQLKLIPPPVIVDFSYLVTAWSDSAIVTPVIDEHHMLYLTMLSLIRNTVIPENYLQGNLQGIEPLPRTMVLHENKLHSTGEFWSALGGKPKPFLNYTVSVSIDAFDSLEAYKIGSIEPKIRKTSDMKIAIQGQIMDANVSPAVPITGAPAENTRITIVGTAQGTGFQGDVLVKTDGTFEFVGLDDDDYTLNVSIPTYGSAAKTITIARNIQGNLTTVTADLELTN
ncbi:MAG: DUF4255 domain-containing protein [Gammaproteobacteria bacterium]|nr:DUF4255 domain-containing protein [Gammaproteobacteria bacterium]